MPTPGGRNGRAHLPEWAYRWKARPDLPFFGTLIPLLGQPAVFACSAHSGGCCTPPALDVTRRKRGHSGARTRKPRARRRQVPPSSVGGSYVRAEGLQWFWSLPHEGVLCARGKLDRSRTPLASSPAMASLFFGGVSFLRPGKSLLPVPLVHDTVKCDFRITSCKM
jgi:hypothetical protein